MTYSDSRKFEADIALIMRGLVAAIERREADGSLLLAELRERIAAIERDVRPVRLSGPPGMWG